MHQRLHHLARGQLRVVEHLANVAHFAVRHAGRIQPGNPLGVARRPEHAIDRRPHLIVVGHAVLVGGEARIGGQLGQTRRGAEALPDVVVADGDHDLAVTGRERFVRRDGGVAVALALRRLAGGEPVRGLVGEQCRCRIQHPDVDALPNAKALARQQRGGDALCAIETRHHVGDRHAQPVTGAIGIPGDAHQPAFGLHHRVVPGFVAARTGLAIAGDRGVDQAGTAAVHGVPAETGPLERAGPEVLHQHVGLLDQLLEHRAPRGRLVVERDAFLVAVDAQEVRALGTDKRRAPVARVVALAGLFNLDDARAEIAQHHGAVRAREHTGEIQNGKTC